MASPQTENGYIRIANELFDALILAHIPATERKVFDAIMRNTYGYNKKLAPITLVELRRLTGMERRNCWRAVKSLEHKQMIFRQGHSLGIKKDYAKWKA